MLTQKSSVVIVAVLLLFFPAVHAQVGVACCTQTFAVCTTYCTTQQECNPTNCGDSTVVWVPNGVPPPGTCLPRWSTCTTNTAGCCPGLTCVGDQWWKGCQYVAPNSSTTTAPITTVATSPAPGPVSPQVSPTPGPMSTPISPTPGPMATPISPTPGPMSTPVSPTPGPMSTAISPTPGPMSTPVGPTNAPNSPVSPVVPIVSPTVTPVTPTLAPVTPTNKPIAPTLAPVQPVSTTTLTAKPTGKPTLQPTGKPTAQPTRKPTGQPSRKPTAQPTVKPVAPTIKPVAPTTAPVTPPVAPAAPTTAPFTPTATPVQPTSAPVTPTATPVAPTPKPVAPSVAPLAPIAPTSVPVATTTAPAITTPTSLPPYPAGPYVTVATSSQLVTIPDPPTPNLTANRTNCPHLQPGLLDWHSATTWGGAVPQAGTNVTIPPNSNVVITSSVLELLAYVTIPPTSTLTIGESSAGISLDLQGMDVQGVLQAGSESCQIQTPITITLHNSRPVDAVTNLPPVIYKGIAVSGTLSLHGKRYSRTWTRLAKTVNVGDSVLMLQHPVNWEAGQQIVLVTTAVKDSKEWHQNEIFTVSAVHPNPPANVGAVVYLTTSATYTHTADNNYQAEVGLLSRKIVVQGSAADSEPNDPDPLNCQGNWIYGNYGRPCGNTELTGYGGHMVVRSGGVGYVEGVELFRMGQTNVLGKYPMHFHLLGECPTCYFRYSSIHRSYYRCISIHGTNSSTVSENVAYDITGYCYYLEDGVESNNTISFNLAAFIHNIGPENPSGGGQTTNVYQQSSMLTNPADVTASGFYVTNVHNNLIGNAASGGWAGFAFPNLPTALQSFQTLVFRPSSVTSLTINGNTAHSTGWWWYHAGAFYFGGSLYYNNGVLEYNAGRDFDANHGRSTCTVNACALGDCVYGCPQYDVGAVRLNNTKVFLVPSVGLNSWTGRLEVSGFEAHDVALMLEGLSDGFWLDKAFVFCRTGETWTLPPGGSAAYIRGNGFFWYDTYQNHIMTNTEFRNCGYRSPLYNQYDNSTTRGCGDAVANGCSSDSTTFGFLAHSDQYIPQVMQGTKNITFTSCGRRFYLYNFNGDTAPETVSGRSQNWLDADGSVTGLHVPSIIGSGETGSQGFWQVEDSVVYEPQGPLRFIKQTNGPQRGLGHVAMQWDSSVNGQVGGSVCSNGNPSIPCPTLGYMRHLGLKFSTAYGAAPGMPVNAGGNIVGPVGGYGWLLNLAAGAPVSISFPEVVVGPDTPLIISIPYPKGTAFTITANAPSWCWTENGAYSCQQQFIAVASLAQVRNGGGNVYYVDPNGVLTFRLVQLPKDFVGRPNWFLPTYNDTGRDGLGYALDFFSQGGVTLPRVIFGSSYSLTANCPSSGAYCAQAPPIYDPDVCPSGYQQVTYDACCSTSNSSCVYADGSLS